MSYDGQTMDKENRKLVHRDTQDAVKNRFLVSISVSEITFLYFFLRYSADIIFPPRWNLAYINSGHCPRERNAPRPHQFRRNIHQAPFPCTSRCAGGHRRTEGKSASRKRALLQIFRQDCGFPFAYFLLARVFAGAAGVPLGGVAIPRGNNETARALQRREAPRDPRISNANAQKHVPAPQRRVWWLRGGNRLDRASSAAYARLHNTTSSSFQRTRAQTRQAPKLPFRNRNGRGRTIVTLLARGEREIYLLPRTQSSHRKGSANSKANKPSSRTKWTR